MPVPWSVFARGLYNCPATLDPEILPDLARFLVQRIIDTPGALTTCERANACDFLESLHTGRRWPFKNELMVQIVDCVRHHDVFSLAKTGIMYMDGPGAAALDCWFKANATAWWEEVSISVTREAMKEAIK